MVVQIAHGKSDENFGIKGLQPRDQTGKEVCIENWKDSDWEFYIECLDSSMAERAVAFAIKIANDADFGYSQDNRWSAWNSIKANGYNIDGAFGDLDCASFVIIVYILAGLKIAASGYTANIKRIFEATGKFRVYTDEPHLRQASYAKKGSLYLRPKTSERGGHVCIVINDGQNVGTVQSPSIDKPYVEIIGNVNARTGNNKNSLYVGTARVGEKYKFLGKDSVTGWYKILFKGRELYVSNRSDLTRLVI